MYSRLSMISLFALALLSGQIIAAPAPIEETFDDPNYAPGEYFSLLHNDISLEQLCSRRNSRAEPRCTRPERSKLSVNTTNLHLGMMTDRPSQRIRREALGAGAIPRALAIARDSCLWTATAQAPGGPSYTMAAFPVLVLVRLL